MNQRTTTINDQLMRNNRKTVVKGNGSRHGQADRQGDRLRQRGRQTDTDRQIDRH